MIRTLALASLLSLLLLPAAAENPAAVEAPAPSGPGYPTVEFSYHFVPFDRACSEASGVEIPEAWREELESKVDSFKNYWKVEGPKLLEAVVAEVDKPFRQREMIAVMSLCKFPSMSHPLLLNMRRFLEAPMEGKGEPRSKAMFAALVLHELLHTYVVDNIEDSAIDEKYQEEPGSVRSHIHLMALIKTVYLKQGRKAELEEIIARDSAIGPIYARAWEIVNDLEGQEKLVAELRQ